MAECQYQTSIRTGANTLRDQALRAILDDAQLKKLAIEAQKYPPYSEVNLSQWFENIFEAGWQAVETLVSKEPNELASSFRSMPSIRRCKLI